MALSPSDRPDIVTLRGMPVMSDADVADGFGIATKRVNEAVQRNAEKFGPAHSFVLSAAEAAQLRSQCATSKSGRGGRRHAVRVFTLKGVARLATVLRSPQALAAADLIIDTFLEAVRRQDPPAVTAPPSVLAAAQPGQALQDLQRRLLAALSALVDTVIDAKSGLTVRHAAAEAGVNAIAHVQQRLKTRGLENDKLSADTQLVLATAEARLADARKTEAEAEAIELQTKIDLVYRLYALSQKLQAADFLTLVEEFPAPRRIPQLPSEQA
ncbi:MAG: ORF6N domain-containing protein [Rhodothalassiaceae bacterium]